MKTVRDCGEFGMITRWSRLLPAAEGVLEGIGDDCAVVRLGDRTLLLTCDASLEGVHFDRTYTPPRAIGWRAMASAISDIAAMGGRPLFALVTVACPADSEISFMDEVYRGLADAAGQCGAAIIGGDTTRSMSGLVLDVAVAGEPVGAPPALRHGACPGDLLAVTGWPGQSAAGLIALQSGVSAPALVQAHLYPVPRIAEGQWLAGQPGVRAMIDVSDGLLQDAGHLAEAAGLGIDVDPAKLPVSADLQRNEIALGVAPPALVLGGGEDYELAVALQPEHANVITREFQSRFGIPLTIVGAFTSDFTGARVAGETPAQSGFDHFG